MQRLHVGELNEHVSAVIPVALLIIFFSRIRGVRLFRITKFHLHIRDDEVDSMVTVEPLRDLHRTIKIATEHTHGVTFNIMEVNQMFSSLDWKEEWLRR